MIDYSYLNATQKSKLLNNHFPSPSLTHLPYWGLLANREKQWSLIIEKGFSHHNGFENPNTYL